jgi:2-dehydropantoate 2-reductase
VTSVTIFGAGAIGGCVGALMVRAGEHVQFVDKMSEHVDAINAEGLRITGAENFSVPARACTPSDLRGPLGLVFLAVKSQDTDAAIDVLAPLAGPDTVLVSLQNGVNGPRIAARLGAERVISAFVSFPADWQAPGHIEHGGAGNIWIGEVDGRVTERLHRIKHLLDHAVTAHVTENILGYLWAKQIDCSLLFAQAVTNETFASLYGNRRYQPLLVALLGEGLAVARAAGVHLQCFDELDLFKMQPRTVAEEEEAMAILSRFADFWAARVKVRSGPWRDLAVRKRPTEVDHMVGWVIEEGRQRGVTLPLSEQLVEIVKDIEQGRRMQGLQNLDQLEAQRQARTNPA